MGASEKLANRVTELVNAMFPGLRPVRLLCFRTVIH